MDTLLSNLNLMQIIIFITVVDENGFSRAGNKLHMTQSAVTKSISRLESELDLRLFIRTTRQLEITPAGNCLYTQWKEQLSMMQSAYCTAKSLAANSSRSLRIGITSTTNPELYFWPLADHFRQIYPDAELIVESDSMEILREKLLTNVFDVIFLPHFEHFSLDDKSIPWKWTAKDHTYVYMSVNHPLARHSCLTLNDLKDTGLLILDQAHNPNYIRDIQELFATEGLTPHITKSLPNAYTIKASFCDLHDVIIADSYFDFANGTSIKRIPIQNHHNGIICAWQATNANSVLPRFLEIIDPMILKNKLTI